ncbi:MAG: hypothetical protein ETSY2_19425 [Candidatus Entotheonella gemina]|uniref:P/Homo B domain-containing protein n=1 Tax=Candidatus Entotheonella gemina TaxID=1429439 RepID=W4M759_9BACT|nr:MAG: hypothetical protein ETSY2_19425 [Candidatus Entotheonella gemina]
MSARLTVQPLSAVEVADVPAIDAQAEFAAAEQVALLAPGPQSYAIPTAVHLTPQTAGTWEALPKGSRLWRLRVLAPGATDLNFGFTRYRLPQGAALHIISSSEDHYEGPFTAEDNRIHGQLWTPVIPGDEAVIELYVPSGGEEPELVLSHIGSGFRDLFKREPDLIKQSGACNIDVICPEGDPWRNEIRSVARYSIGGAGLCTGTLIMDAESSFTPFFLTANHCGITLDTAPTLVFFWNFESLNCGDRSGGSLADTQSGATFRAARADVDMALVELDAQPDAAFNVFYSGWDRSGMVPMGSVGIHHPAGDVKAISFNDDPLTTGNSCIGPVGRGNTHWSVDDWEQGTTERGSSGSGLWDPANQKLVGFLSGGRAACGILDFDCYGKFSEAWEGDTAAERLRDWLDPNNLGVMMVDGADPDDDTDPPPDGGPELPADIPDNDPAGVSSPRDIMETGTVTELAVRVQINHTWVGDLRIVLRSPAGTEVILLDRPGVPNTNFGCSNDNMDVTFRDGAGIDPETHCEGTIPWLTGDALPVDALSMLAGESRQGMWTLTVSDNAMFDIGQLVNWELIFDLNVPPTQKAGR